MKLAFYLEDPTGFGWMAEAFVKSARQYGLDRLHIVQLSPHGVPAVLGVDDLFPMALAPNLSFFGRYFASALIYHRWHPAGGVMFCNVDMLFVRPWAWAHLFGMADGFHKNATLLPHIKDRRWKWDGAVCVLPDPHLLAHVVNERAAVENCSIEEQLQCLANVVAKSEPIISWLPGDVWSYVPGHAVDIGTRAVLVHYRGPRKDWMAQRLGMQKAPTDWAAQRQETHRGTTGG